VKIRALSFRAALLATAVLLALGCAGRGHLIRHDSTAQELDGLVDSDPARRLLRNFLARRSLDPNLEALAVSSGVVQESGGGAVGHPPVPDQARLRELSQEISLDFAALSFADAISADRMSRVLQVFFTRVLDDGVPDSEQLLRTRGAFPYTVLFAPSWMYRSHPETGADFAHQRRVLDRLGIANRLIPTEESASVEDNAVAIGAAIRVASRGEDDIIVVSASKSGAEAALALSRVLAPTETRRVVAWVNVVGALRGSPLADSALRPPISWVARSVFWVRGWNWAGLASMATGPSRDRLHGARIPESIAVINVVAVPLSGSIGMQVHLGYKMLQRHGPNDGVVLLTDTVWPGGANVVAVGPDHLFRPREDDAHSLALLRMVDLAVRLHRGR
jgi:ADP-ribose pyrophosphatase YjhB (NUDIX family)